jgi:large subunit ribosomal protein L23
MALFTTKKKTETKKTEAKPAKKVAEKSVAESSGIKTSLAHVLKNPRITEKASMHQSIGVYTFDVAKSATKTQIAEAVSQVYKVTPRKVAIVTIHAKRTRSMRNGKSGMSSGGKKAYVYLRSGETITIA